MKITDLMHGDWFNSKKGTCRINEIKLFTAIVEMSDEAYANGAESSYEMDFEYDLEPIPVTKEMLLANGFKLDECQGNDTGYEYLALVLSEDEEMGVDVSYYLGDIDTFRVSAKYYSAEVPAPFYVHQYQHALRLMGLDELADKFTLTEKQPLKS